MTVDPTSNVSVVSAPVTIFAAAKVVDFPSLGFFEVGPRALVLS
jgi:hypothetical protein